MKYTNPIMAGCYPDPSICKYQDTYYLVNSTFQYFPGVTLFESKDLLNWTQIGHVLTRESQLPLEHAGRSGGIYAPTIRCHEGRFYMVVTNVSSTGNFYVWTDDIHGEWSEPIIVDQGGIDPSLYFEDGICYFMSNGTDKEGRNGILQCEIDIETGKKLNEERCIWNGTGGRYLEGPHLYKIRGEYYIIAAEGGTEYGHMIISAKGKTPYGPFVSAPNNPILTNRNLGGYEIQGCGHGDLVEDSNGNWWMVHLAFRQTGLWSMFHITGRETYLVPVEFDESGWISLGQEGTTRMEVETDKLPSNLRQIKRKQYTIENTRQEIEWCFLRNYDKAKYKFTKETIELTGTTKKLSDDFGSPTFTCIRQCEMVGTVTCQVEVEEQEAGISLYMDNLHHYDFGVKTTQQGTIIQKCICIGDITYVQESRPIEIQGVVKVELCIRFTPTAYFFEAVYQEERHEFGQNQSKYLSTEVAEGFTGVMIGLYAQSEERDCNKPAIFKQFACEYAEEQM